MRKILHFEPITQKTYQTYIDVGTCAYNQHYLHLWPNKNSLPYIKNSFTKEVLQQEEKDENTILYLIKLNKVAVGIFKITLDFELDSYNKREALYIDKIYIIAAYANQGIGKKIIQFIELRAQKLSKKVICLDTMQKGPALNFYLKNGFKIHKATNVSFKEVLKEERAMWVMLKEVMC